MQGGHTMEVKEKWVALFDGEVVRTFTGSRYETSKQEADKFRNNAMRCGMGVEIKRAK